MTPNINNQEVRLFWSTFGTSWFTVSRNKNHSEASNVLLHTRCTRSVMWVRRRQPDISFRSLVSSTFSLSLTHTHTHRETLSLSLTHSLSLFIFLSSSTLSFHLTEVLIPLYPVFFLSLSLSLYIYIYIYIYIASLLASNQFLLTLALCAIFRIYSSPILLPSLSLSHSLSHSLSLIRYLSIYLSFHIYFS